MRDPLHRIPVRYRLSAALVGVCLVAFVVGGYLVFGSEKSDLETEIRGRLSFQSRACASPLDAELRRHLEWNKLPTVEAFTALDVFGPDGIPVISTAT